MERYIDIIINCLKLIYNWQGPENQTNLQDVNNFKKSYLKTEEDLQILVDYLTKLYKDADKGTHMEFKLNKILEVANYWRSLSPYSCDEPPKPFEKVAIRYKDNRMDVAFRNEDGDWYSATKEELEPGVAVRITEPVEWKPLKV